MRFKGIIFDLDGVLCRTDKYHYLAWKALTDRLGVRFDEQINDRLRGLSRMDSLEIVFENSPVVYSQEEKFAFAEEKNNLYRQMLQAMSPADVSAEVRGTLQTLKNLGIKIAVGSSSKNAPLILEKTDLAKYFDAVCDGNNISRGKPDPEVFLKAAQMLGLQPQQCAVVEDADSGIIAAKRGNFTALAVGNAITLATPDCHLEKLSDLLSL